MRTLTFNKNFGAFKQGETYDIDKNLTANYFVSNNIANEEVEVSGCVDCKPKAEEPTVKPDKQNKTKKTDK